MPPKIVRGAIRRPAAKPMPLRRPAKRREEQADEEEPKKFQKFSEVDLRKLTGRGPVALEDARYYGRAAPVAGHFRGLCSEGDGLFMKLQVSGTKNEELLRVLSGKKDRIIQVHLCEEGCTGLVTDETLVHATGFEETELGQVPWLTNLQAVGAEEDGPDEMAALRKEKERMEKESEDLQKKASKKEKKRKKAQEGEEGRVRKSPKKEGDGLEVGQVPLETLFRFTGMDPEPGRRARVLKRARRIGKAAKKRKKRKEKGSSTSGTSSSSSSSQTSLTDYGTEGLFEEEKKLRSIWRRCPGALTARSIQEIKRSLTTSAGTMWDVNKAALPPLYTQYGRQVVMQGMSAALQQESLTLCQSLDLLAQGHVASCMDLLNQRLKSLEALSKGAHWTLCRQYELVKIEEGGMTEETERLGAARRAREEEKLRNLMTRPQASKGGDASQGGKTRKGKEGKGGNKGVSSDGGKGKGGSGGKESKGSWEKKTEK